MNNINNANYRSNPLARGKIKFPNRKKQLLDYSGLLFDNITPSDIDGIIEWHDGKYAILEYKYKTAQMPFGQKLLLERMANDLYHSGKEVVVLVAKHEEEDCNKEVDAAKCIVRELYIPTEGVWRKPKSEFSVLEICDKFFDE